jgi:hypothetical protein
VKRYFVQISICILSVPPTLDMARAQQCTPPPAGMVAWYTGDGNANDFLGNNNGAAPNGVTFMACKVGQAFSLNGSNQYVTVPSNVIPYPVAGTIGTQPFSVDAWFQTFTGGVILGQQGAVSPLSSSPHCSTRWSRARKAACRSGSHLAIWRLT